MATWFSTLLASPSFDEILDLRRGGAALLHVAGRLNFFRGIRVFPVFFSGSALEWCFDWRLFF